MAGVREAIPLAAFRSVVVVEHIVIREGSQRMNSVRHGVAANSDGLAKPILASSRKIFPDRTKRAASTRPSGVRKFRQPSSSFSPNTPQDAPAGGARLDGQLVIVWKLVEVHRDNRIRLRDGEVTSANRS